MCRKLVTLGWLLVAGALAASSCAGPPAEVAAPTKSPTTGSVSKDGKSHWVKSFRFTAIDASNEQVGHRPQFESKTPHDVLCWARFNRMMPAGRGGSDVESFQILVSGLSHPIQVEQEQIGDAMSGVVPLGEAGDCYLEMMTTEDYVIEIYTPSNPDVVPPDSPPIPKPTTEEMQDFKDEQKLQDQDWPSEKKVLDQHVDRVVKDAKKGMAIPPPAPSAP